MTSSVQLVGVPVLVPPEPHQRLAGGDGPDPAPETALLAVPADAPADLEEGLLEHVLGVFGGAADPAGEVVDGRLEGPEERLQGGGVPGPGPGDDRLGIGEQVRIHQEGPRHGPYKMPGPGEWSHGGSVKRRA